MFNNNKIFIIDKKGNCKRIFFKKGLSIIFKGKNSVVTLHEPCIRFKNSKIICADNCSITIGGYTTKKRKVNKLNLFALAENSVCNIGKDLSVTEDLEICFHEPNLKVEIGDDCMFAKNVNLRTSDVHSILNSSGEVTNYGASIKIGNHCWISDKTTILKGVSIADNVVIGCNSVVNKNCADNNSIYGGVPARPLTSNINWKRERP